MTDFIFHKPSLYRPLARGFAAVLVGTLLVSGCINPERTVKASHPSLPEQFASTESDADAETVLLTNWVESFGSPTLSALVEEALANNRDLQVAAARVEEARALTWIATGAMLPSLDASAGASRARSNFETGSGKAKVLSTSMSVQADLSWELDLWGKLYDRRKAAVKDYQAQLDTWRGAQLSLVGQIVRSWYALVDAEEQLRLAEETEESFVRAERMVRDRYERGLRRALDVRLTASNAASARALSAARREQVRRASLRLEVLVGRVPGGALKGDGEFPGLSPATTDLLPTSLLARRPDLAARRAEAVAAELRSRAAAKDLLPSLRLTGGAGYQDGELKNLEDPSNLIWSLAGGLIQPLFQGGALKGRLDAAQARGDQATARYAQSLLTALEEVEAALYAEQTLAIQEENLKEAAHQAKAAEASASDLYQRGLTGIFELLEAQRRSLNAQSSYLDIQQQRVSNRVTLIMALGGDIPRQTLAQVSPSTAEEQDL